MKLQVGKMYLLRGGEIATITKFENNGTSYRFIGTIGGEPSKYTFAWIEDGSFLARGYDHYRDVVDILE
jgi:hypothetical protein